MSHPLSRVTRNVPRAFQSGDMTRSSEEYEAVRALLAEGHNDCEVSRRTGISRGTVKDWRHGVSARSNRSVGRKGVGYECSGEHDFSDLPPSTYGYLLGMYLGDGCLSSRPRGVFQLRIVCDNRYPGIIDECCRAIEALMPKQRAYRLQRKGCVEISMHSKHWICLFPQHGPGRKHNRPIHLERWQENLVNQSTESFLRGLIHSDGCRVVANDRGVRSVRYHFSNRSKDIKGLFCAALDRLEIPWTRPCDRQIAVYRKAATARLDEFIGPKY